MKKRIPLLALGVLLAVAGIGWLSHSLHQRSVREMSASQLDRYVQVHPDDIEARRLLGVALLKIEQAARAQDILARVHEEVPNRQDVFEEYCVALLLNNQTQAARQQLQELLRQYPRDENALSDLGQLELTAGNLAAAQPLLDQAHQINAQDPNVNRALAFLQQEKSRPSNAVQPASQRRQGPAGVGTDTSPDATLAAPNIGAVARRRLVGTDTSPDATLADARDYLLHRRFDLALQACDSVLSRNPRNTQARSLRLEVMKSIAANLAAPPGTPGQSSTVNGSQPVNGSSPNDALLPGGGRS